jgi:hypothetical protein
MKLRFGMKIEYYKNQKIKELKALLSIYEMVYFVTALCPGFVWDPPALLVLVAGLCGDCVH